MAKTQIDPDLIPQRRVATPAARAPKPTPMPVANATAARMKAGRGISNGVKPGKQRVR